MQEHCRRASQCVYQATRYRVVSRHSQPSLDRFERGALDLDIAVQWKLVNGNAGPALARQTCQTGSTFEQATRNSYRFWLPDEELVVDLVHGSKVAHVGEKDVNLDDVLEAAARRIEDGRQVLECLALSPGEHTV